MLAAALLAAAPARPAALPHGPAMIVVAPPEDPARDGEARGDWAYYLNDFAGGRLRELPVTRITPGRWRDGWRRPALRDPYATMFVRANGRAILHRGMILEPDPYRDGARWLAAAPSASVPRGFEAVRVERRR